MKMLELVSGSVVCVFDGERKEFSSGQEAMDQIKDKYDIAAVAAEEDKVVLTLQKDKVVPNDMNADWVKDHIAKYDVEPNPFDGM